MRTFSTKLLSQQIRMPTLLPNALLTVSKFEEFQRLSTCVSEGSVGHLNIGFGISTYQYAPECIAQFKSLYPNVHVTLNDLPASVQEQKLLSGELHIGFTRLQHLKSPLKGINLLTDSLSIAVHKDEVINLNNIWQSISRLDYLQLNPTRGAQLHQQIGNFLAHKNLTLKATQEADDILTLLALVSANLGYTIIPSSSIAICQPNIRLIPLKGKMALWDIGLIWNPILENKVIQRFIEHVEKT